MSNQTPNNPVNVLSLSAELREMTYAIILEDCQEWVGPYGQQPQNGAIVRRFISDEASLPNSNSRYPGHAMLYVHPDLTDEFQEYWEHTADRGLTLGDVHLIPAGLFNGITNLAMNMEQAVAALQVTVPNIREPNDAIPPNTHLVLTHAPSVQHLDIYWETQLSGDPSSPDETPIQVLLARLEYFRRSFRAVVNWEAYDGATMLCSGTLLDAGRTFTNQSSRPAGEFAGFLFHLDSLSWSRRILTAPNLTWSRNTAQYAAVIEAHPWYDHVPLGWSRRRRFLQPASEYRVQVSAMRRGTPRPYDT